MIYEKKNHDSKIFSTIYLKNEFIIILLKNESCFKDKLTIRNNYGKNFKRVIS